ncbi:dihydroneopterin aldolase [Legionella jamestowniensis]|uniref:7,8-dihydroneopterin aldolase n=1 Tax=Legionella jamestowniensis TaxID=455 RepID=A0A0W0UKX3_9GAMM|nr:dihydroneopterin aldolase [Legionella jamestowniensis]KTD08516.1 dihydroneopterin aldolase FolB [Legionella jamestowniensis]OCH97021.1 dihydroneopterin aldolase [Legionella jamestowniensis]SFL52317.1 dihydroneopterin aldolase [Legionella jamestowniensis DSM 19215]
MDLLQIKGLCVLTRIGVYTWEQEILQRLFIDISIPGNFNTCKDDIANTIDYAKVCQQVTAYIESNSFRLIETVAENVANLIKQEFNIPQLTVSVSKPHAIKNANDIRVTVTR